MPDKQGERIAAVRKQSGLSQGEFAKAIGLRGNSGISQFENGTSRASDQTLMVIADKFNVNYQWLMSGKGDMNKPKPLEKNSNPAAEAFIMIERLDAEHNNQIRELHGQIRELHGIIKYTQGLLDECRTVNKEYRELLKKNNVRLSS